MTAARGENEVATGVRAVLANPSVYELWSSLVGGKKARRTIVAEHLRPDAGDELLDLGCGPAELLAHLPDGTRYSGIDISPEYIARAHERHGTRGRFEVADASQLALGTRRFDLVFAVGLLHHLDDAQAVRLMRDVAALLTSTGRFVSVDPVYTDRQNPFARAVIRRDRGRHVRTVAQYEGLARSGFASVRTVVRTDLLRIPYTHCVMQAGTTSP